MTEAERKERNEINEAWNIGKVRGIRKGRTPTHPGLCAIAGKLAGIEFVNPLTADEVSLVKAGQYQSHKGITVLPYASGMLWSVRMSCHGMTLILGSANGAGLEFMTKMLRYADMCHLKFWPYRLRLRRPPKVGELNISLARATQDLKNEPSIVELLNEVERFLLANGIVNSIEQITAELKESQTNRVQKTRQALREINARLAELEKGQKTIMSIVSGLQKDNMVLMQSIGVLLNQKICCTPPSSVVCLSSEKFEA